MQSESGLGAGVERVRSNGRRVFTLAHKRSVVEQCLRPGASVAGVAMAHGINANLVRKWIDKHKAARQSHAPTLLPVSIASMAPLPAGQQPPPPRRPPVPAASCLIEVEVHGARVRLFGRVDADQLRGLFDALAPR